MPSKSRNRFEQAVNVVSTRIKLILLQIPESQTDTIQEIRMRINKPLIIVNERGSHFLTDRGKLSKIHSESCIVTLGQEIADTLNRACNYSVHSFQQNINNGFLTIDGGHRIGLAGTAVSLPDGSFNVKDVSFLNIRIARQVFGVSQPITDLLTEKGIKSIIVAGPPSSGKTTFLRDFAYRISSGFTGDIYKTVVIDERGELSAPHFGTPQNDLGLNSDILINYRKSDAVEISLRSLSPEYIIFDEICSENDLEAIKSGINSGVKFAVSIHCGNEKELKNKRLLNELLKTEAFIFTVLLSDKPVPATVKKIYKTEIKDNEIIWNDIDYDMLGSFGNCNTLAYEKENSPSSENSDIA
ncbi:MAG: stage III sporulation protein AA [Clostridiales bacterium]|nr:stage III sporulation protein AA [Clostridiales bacterium]